MIRFTNLLQDEMAEIQRVNWEELVESFISDMREWDASLGVHRVESGTESVDISNISVSEDTMDVHHDIADEVVDGFAVSDEWVVGKLHRGGMRRIRVYVREPCDECDKRPVQNDAGLCDKCHPEEHYWGGE